MDTAEKSVADALLKHNSDSAESAELRFARSASEADGERGASEPLCGDAGLSAGAGDTYETLPGPTTAKALVPPKP